MLFFKVFMRCFLVFINHFLVSIIHFLIFEMFDKLSKCLPYQCTFFSQIVIRYRYQGRHPQRHPKNADNVPIAISSVYDRLCLKKSRLNLVLSNNGGRKLAGRSELHDVISGFPSAGFSCF